MKNTPPFTTEGPIWEEIKLKVPSHIFFNPKSQLRGKVFKVWGLEIFMGVMFTLIIGLVIKGLIDWDEFKPVGQASYLEIFCYVLAILAPLLFVYSGVKNLIEGKRIEKLKNDNPDQPWKWDYSWDRSRAVVFKKKGKGGRFAVLVLGAVVFIPLTWFWLDLRKVDYFYKMWFYSIPIFAYVDCILLSSCMENGSKIRNLGILF